MSESVCPKCMSNTVLNALQQAEVYFTTLEHKLFDSEEQKKEFQNRTKRDIKKAIEQILEARTAKYHR